MITQRPTRILLAALAAAPFTLPSVSAQAQFQEDFDNLSAFVSGQLGPASLVQQG